MEHKRTVDWMCIGIEKLSDTDTHVDYAFVSDVRERDPRYRSRSVIVGQNRGRLRIMKATGDVTLLEPMPGDEESKRFQRAAARIKKHWDAHEFPDKTMFACG
jgi:hypothetical protein